MYKFSKTNERNILKGVRDRCLFTRLRTTSICTELHSVSVAMIKLRESEILSDGSATTVFGVRAIQVFE
jgi:hypothetical protein